MITKVKVELTFPQGAKFRGNINLILYKRLINFIKKLNCYNTLSKCYECPFQDNCGYYKITGENFKGYSGILVDNNLFEKNVFYHNEKKSIIFYFIGNNNISTDYVDLMMESLNQHIFGNIFYLNKIEKTTLDNSIISCNKAFISTPIEQLSFKESYNQMINYYNENYNCNYNFIENSIDLVESKKTIYNKIKFNTKTIDVSGYIGNIYDNLVISNDLLETGIGKFNFMGGGHIEIKN